MVVRRRATFVYRTLTVGSTDMVSAAHAFWPALAAAIVAAATLINVRLVAIMFTSGNVCYVRKCVIAERSWEAEAPPATRCAHQM